MWQPHAMAATQLQAVPEREDDESAYDDELMRSLVNAYVKERDEYVRDRAASGVELQWSLDIQYYHGKDEANLDGDMMQAIATRGERGGRPNRDDETITKSRVSPNITRPKANSAEARLADMLFPHDEKNWGIKPTPVPELAELANDDTPLVHQGEPIMVPDDGEESGQRQMQARDYANELTRLATERSKAMEREIEDQLTECSFNGTSRSMIHDAVLYGTGIVKGPVVRARREKSWKRHETPSGVVHVLQFNESKVPVTERVNPEDFFPDMACGNDIRNAEAIWERRFISKRKLRQLARAPGYNADAIRECLVEGPQRSYLTSQQGERRDENGYVPPQDRQYEVWERHGDIDPRVLEMCGCDVGEVDPLMSISGCLVIINDRPVKAYLNPLESGDLPYDVLVWEPAQNRIFGYGIPYLLRQSAQRMVTAATRQIMDNAGMSAGAQIVMSDHIEPKDGNWTVGGGTKLWGLTGEAEMADVTKAFGLYTIDPHTEHFLKIIELALKFADEEIAFPMIMAGERGDAPAQVGSMQMLMNSATVVLRRLVKRYDDDITRPHLRRYYDWNMQYNPKEEIKGDYEVDARGSTTLMQRDLANQAMVKWLAALTNPAISYMFDDEKMVRKALTADSISPDDVLREPDEIKKRREQMQQQKPTPTPDTMVKAQTAMQVAQLKEQGLNQRTAAELQADAEERRQQAEHDMLMRGVDAEDKQRDRDHAERKALSSDKVKLAQQALQIRNDREAEARGAKTVAIT